MNDIESFEQKYIGSDEEKADVLQAYIASDGDVNRIIQSVFFMEENDEDLRRLSSIIDTLIQGEHIKCLQFQIDCCRADKSGDAISIVSYL